MMPNYAWTDVSIDIPVENYPLAKFEELILDDNNDRLGYMSRYKVYGVNPETFFECKPNIPVGKNKYEWLGQYKEGSIPPVITYGDDATLEEVMRLIQVIRDLGFDPTKPASKKTVEKFVEKAKKEYGEDVFDWYEWNVSNLDTKWVFELESLTVTNHTDVTNISFRTETAWSPPEAWLYKIVELFPVGTTMNWTYELEGDEWAHGDDCYDEDEDEYRCDFTMDSEHGCEPMRYEGSAHNG